MSDPDSPSTQDPIPNPNISAGRKPSSPLLALLQPPSSSALDAAASTAELVSAVATAKKSRRLPPPCWSPEETIALIDAYSDKWHSLHRGNLKANHWEEVAGAVAARCPSATPQKTAVQCRHKMEKLRKRYRAEIQRARSVPVSRFVSSWVHYRRMEAMEKGSETKSYKGTDIGDDNNDEDEDHDADRHPRSGDGYKNGDSVAKGTPGFFNKNGISISSGGAGSSSAGSGGFRIRIPTGVRIAQHGPRFPGKIDQRYTMNLNSGVTVDVTANHEGRKVRAGTVVAKREGNVATNDDPTVASAIKLLGETLMRTEQSRMEMVREIEAMKMEMDMKRTEMILESQKHIVEAFAKALAGKKKKQRTMASDNS